MPYSSPEKQRTWHENNRELSRETQRAWRKANPDKVKKAQKKYRAANAERNKPKAAVRARERYRSDKKRFAAEQRAYYAANCEAIREREQKRHAADPRRRLLNMAKSRAKAKGLAFDLCLGDITIPEACPLLGIAIRVNEKVLCDNSPSLDRIRNEAGYVRGNIAVVSHAANRRKGSWSAADFLDFGAKLLELERA